MEFYFYIFNTLFFLVNLFKASNNADRIVCASVGVVTSHTS